MTLEPKRILWPTDFSELSLRAGRYARALAELFHAELHAIHVIPPPLTPDVSLVLPTEFPVAVMGPELLETSKTALAELVAKNFSNLTTKTDAFYDNPWNGVCEYARKKEIDLIVISTHGRTGLTHVLLGSTAERIVQHAPCPVLSIKSGGRDFLRT